MLLYDSILHHMITFLCWTLFHQVSFTCALLHVHFYMCTFTFYSNSNVSLYNTFIDIHYVIAINYKHKVIITIQWIKSNEIVRSSYVMFNSLSEILFNRKLITLRLWCDMKLIITFDKCLLLYHTYIFHFLQQLQYDKYNLLIIYIN